jgi:hypothetical protein
MSIENPAPRQEKVNYMIGERVWLKRDMPPELKALVGKFVPAETVFEIEEIQDNGSYADNLTLRRPGEKETFNILTSFVERVLN